MFNINELTCRVCLEDKNVMINIYDELEDLNTNLSNLLETCGDLQINEDDVFPKYLCEDCTRELLITSRFLEKCCKSKVIFNEILENAKEIGTENSFNSNDLIEYCAEYANEIDEQDLIIEDHVTDYDPYPENLIDAVEQVDQSAETSLLKESILELKNAELNHQAIQENVIDETTLSGDYFNQLHKQTDNDPVDRDDAASTIQDESTNIIFTESLSANPKTIQVFKCDVCGALFKQAINLQKHLQKAHDPIPCFICSKCNQCFSLETEFHKHVEDCGCTTEINTENVKSNEETEYSRECTYCKRNFPTPFALRMHLRTHTGERPFQCKYCTKSFKTQSQLNVHHKRHTGQADFICTFCNKSFYEQSNLTVHIRSHTGERPHVCTICNKTFARVFLLQFHMRTHTGEKPFKCNFCDKCFRQHTDLRSHLTTHTGQKRHNCTLCRKSYTKHSHLVQHMHKHQINFNSTEAVETVECENYNSAIELDSVRYAETVYNFEEITKSEDIMHAEKI